MANFFGDGVSRVLQTEDRQFDQVVWQQGKPPLDSELALIQQATENFRQEVLKAGIPSGFLSSPYESKGDFAFEQNASNFFYFGPGLAQGGKGDVLWALVNGWPVPIAGTQSVDLRNRILLPPPSTAPSDGDVNFVFIEVWRALLGGNTSTNKPGASQVYRFGNVEFGGTQLPDEIVDPILQKETTKRVQLQYRIRVVSAVDPAIYPYGFNPTIRAQGTLAAPTISGSSLYQFQNMGDILGDPGLWRAGDGNGQSGLLGTVDGYVYALPLAMVFRRTSGAWEVGNQRHQSAYNRNPLMTDRLQAQLLIEPKLVAAISKTATSIVVDTDIASTTYPATNGLIRLNGEVISYSSWVGTTITVTARGAKGTFASAHPLDTPVKFVTGHPEGLFADQIIESDVWDIRALVQPSGFDYPSLLQQNMEALLQGKLQATWKHSEAEMKGLKVFQVDYLGQGSPTPNGTIEGPAPDGFRKIFSDAATLQSNNLLSLGLSSGTSASDLSSNLAATTYRTVASQWRGGDFTVISLAQLRNTFKTAANKKVRFVHPNEYSGVLDIFEPWEIWFGNTNPASGNLLTQTRMGYQSRVLSTVPPVTGQPFVLLGQKVSGISNATQGSGVTVSFTGVDTLIIGGLDFSTDVAALVNQNAWVVVGNTNPASNANNGGAFRIIGSDGGTGFQVETQQGLSPNFTAGAETNCVFYLRLEACTVNDDEAILALTLPGATYATSVNLFVSFPVLYAPMSGLARCPQDSYFVRTTTANATVTGFVRETNFADKAFSTVPTVRDSPCLPAVAYPLTQRGQARSVQSNLPESVWGEAYVDAGSKTLIYQPLRRQVLTLTQQSLAAAPSWAGTINVPGWQLSSSDPLYRIPKEMAPRMGRQDLPFVKSRNVPANTIPYGLNHFLMVSGGDNAAASAPNAKLTLPRTLLVFDASNATPAGTYTSLTAFGGGGVTLPALVCDFYDKGGIRGIRLPAHYGVSRLFAMYTSADFFANGGLSAFAGPTYRDDAGATITNLLRSDAERRSLCIVENEDGSQSYVIPEDTIDFLTLDNPLETSALVLEVALFLFDDMSAPDGFVDIYTTNATGTLPTSLDLFVNGAASTVDEMFVVSTRIPYQGNIYGTMPVSTVDTGTLDFSDYTPKRTLETPAETLNLAEELAIDLARVQNPASVEILAMMPFVTTQGTGAVAGPFQAGSLTDVGYVDMTSYPFTSLTDNPRPLRSRNFTQGVPYLSPRANGVTERLPLGILTADFAFLGEGMAPGYKTRFPVAAQAGPLTHYQNTLQGTAGTEGVLVLSDGTSVGSDALVGYDPSYTLYRTYRGGTGYVGGGENAGLAISLSTERVLKDLNYLTANLRDSQIHGSALFCVALLVRNTPQSVTDQNIQVSYGSELQMVILTGLSLSKELRYADLQLALHPTGAGEGYCAADRYRLTSRVLDKGAKSLPTAPVKRRDPNTQGANFPPVAPPCVCP